MLKRPLALTWAGRIVDRWFLLPMPDTLQVAANFLPAVLEYSRSRIHRYPVA
jgi:hypothetical protein